MHVLLNHLSTPVFVVEQQADHAVRDGTQHRFTTMFDLTAGCDEGARCCHDENFLPEAACDVYPGHPHYTALPASYSEAAFANRVVTTVRALWEGLATRSEMRPGCTGGPCDPSPLPVPMHGAFIDDTADHSTVSDADKVESVIGSRTLEELIYGWIVAAEPTFCVDVSGAGESRSGRPAAWGPCPP
jgi:hypothetical protein